MKVSRLVPPCVLTLLILTVVTACQPTLPRFVDEGRSYNSTSAQSLTEHADSLQLKTEPTSGAAGLRHAAILRLRKKGGSAQEAASLITKTFPSDTKAVPFYVERAKYDSKPAWIIIEAIGPAQGRLRDNRLWVIDDQGNILLSATR